MRKAIIILMTAGLLAGCQQPTGTVTVGQTTITATPTNPVTKITQFTQADLANAIAIAQAAGPNGVEMVNCFTFLQNQLTMLQAQQPNGSGQVGVATVFTVADLALANAVMVTSSSTQTAFEEACGPLVLHVQNQALSFSAQIAQLAALLGK